VKLLATLYRVAQNKLDHFFISSPADHTTWGKIYSMCTVSLMLIEAVLNVRC